MSTQPDSTLPAQDTQKAALDKRLEELGWAAFLIMTGAIWLLPPERVPDGTWLIGTGVLLLVLNAARHFNGMSISGFTSVLGVLALAGGLGELVGVRVPILALCLIVLGASILLKPMLARRK